MKRRRCLVCGRLMLHGSKRDPTCAFCLRWAQRQVRHANDKEMIATYVKALEVWLAGWTEP